MKKAFILLFILISSCTAKQHVSVEEINILNKADNISLAGTLTLPAGKGPFPGVVLISGSGPVDRDETFEGHKFFKVLASYLAESGIASYRYDKRGVGESNGNFETVILENFASDAHEALKFLKSRPEISKAGFIGHSEGGLVGPIASSRGSDCDFMVLMAPPALSIDQTFIKQMEAHLSVKEVPIDEIKKQAEIEEEIWQIIKDGDDLSEIKISVEAVIRKNLNDFYYLKGTNEEDLESKIQGQVDWFVNSINFDYFKKYIDHEFFSDIKCPVFAITGDKDLFVVYPEEFDLIKSQLSSNKDYINSFKVYPNVNHLFQTCETGLYEEVSQITETMNGQVMADIAGWINELK
ncbi:MAG: alpha/beta hydrolase [Allomuricauda sp.]